MRRNLRPLVNGEKPRKNKPYVVCDIETANWTKFLVIGIYDGRDCFYFKRLRDFLEFLFDRYEDFDCFAHFGGRFDFLFILEEILKNDRTYLIESMVPRGSGLLYFELRQGEKRITFRDSSALLPFSLRRLCESFEVTHQKQEIDYTKIKKVTKKLLHYLEHDLKGLYEVIQKFYEWPIIKKAGGSYTLASQAIRVLRTEIKKPIPFLNPSLDKKLRPSYLGGRTEIFKPYYQNKKKPLYCYDVNSLYPTVMRNQDYPTHFLYNTDRFEQNKLGIYQCLVQTPPDLKIPCLGVVHDGKYLFPTGKFHGQFTSAEIKYARSLNYVVEIIEGSVFSNGGRIFRPYVELLYQIRRRASVSGASVDSTIAKLLLNSCYGRFGINSEKENIVFDDGSVGLRPLRELTLGKKTYRLCTKQVELETFSHVGIASFVTSYARIYMHQLFMQAPDELYYTDTDSLYTTHKYPTGKELGDLKLEDTVYSACFLLPKTYIAGQKIAMKGFDQKKIQHFTLEDFHACLEGELRSLHIVQPSRFATFKTALTQGKLVTMTKASTRQIRSRYDKRKIIVTKNGYDSIPMKLKIQGEKNDYDLE